MRLLAIALLLFVLSACSGQQAPPPPAPPPTQTDENFADWVAQFRHEAAEKGISRNVLDKAFAGVEPINRVIALDRKQPETVLTEDEYIERVVTPERVEKGRRLFAKYHDLLENVAARYDVQPGYIVALWGIETNYGERTGGFEIVPALATLAYDGRRSDYFRGELLNALRIAQAENMDPRELSGSWAGAMGQCQFMPSSYLKYAVDFNGDGKRDIWNNEADVFASIANYLHSEGWNGENGLGSPSDHHSNFSVLLKWNRSHNFAAAVGALADKIDRGES